MKWFEQIVLSSCLLILLYWKKAWLKSAYLWCKSKKTIYYSWGKDNLILSTVNAIRLHPASNKMGFVYSNSIHIQLSGFLINENYIYYRFVWSHKRLWIDKKQDTVSWKRQKSYFKIHLMHRKPIAELVYYLANVHFSLWNSTVRTLSNDLDRESQREGILNALKCLFS